MKNLSIATIFVYSALLNLAYGLEAGKWKFVEESEYCYVGSLPTDTDLPAEKKRGDTYILVYKMIGNDETVVQIEAGYKYNIDKNILVNIDNVSFDFYAVEDVPESAWTDSDGKVIYAMKKGLELTVTGESSRGTITNDDYTLKGFTSAFNKLVNEYK